jgi:predicted ATPase
MNIKSFEVWNFKSIEYSGEVRFPKITILIGPNSSGKSSIVQTLLLMKQTFETEEPSIPLTLNGPFIQLGEYGDFIHGRDISQPFVIKFIFEEGKKSPYKCEVCERSYKLKGWFLKHVKELHPKYWESKQYEISDDKYHLPKTSSLTFKYVYDSKTKLIILKEMKIENPPSVNGLNLASLKIEQLEKRIVKFVATSVNGKNIYTKSLQIPNNIENLDRDIMVKLVQYSTDRSFNHIVHSKICEQISLLEKDFGDVLDFKFPEEMDIRPYYFWRIPSQLPRSLNEEQKVALGIESGLSGISRYMSNRIQDVNSFLQGIQHVGPLRNWPERIYFGTGGRPTSVGVRGEFTQELFWIDKRVGHEKLVKDINDWLAKLKLDIELEVVSLGVGDIYQLRVKENDLSINIADVGFGLSQILPIVTECINYKIGDSMKAKEIEQRFYNPFNLRTEKVNKILITEQPEIHLNPRIQAELGDFFIHIADSEKAILIETHSEHIISRIQRRVADGTLKPEDVVIYFISKIGNKSNIKEISISRNGHFNYWPEGFFQDDFEDAIEILKSSLKQEDKK